MMNSKIQEIRAMIHNLRFVTTADTIVLTLDDLESISGRYSNFKGYIPASGNTIRSDYDRLSTVVGWYKRQGML